MAYHSSEALVRSLLDRAGIRIDGDCPHDIQIHNPAFYKRVLSQGSLGLGESYMEGWWDCDAIDQAIDRVLRAGLEKYIRPSFALVWPVLRSLLFNLQKKSRAFQVGEQHYDLGNDLFTAMLDKRMNYSCGYWKTARSLDEAQEAKLDLICRKMKLAPGMTVLEIGCGFGGFASYAAEKYGVEVTGITVSKRQLELGKQRCKGLPVELRLEDYRTVGGTFDRVLSIGMIEHVGYKNYGTYMRVVDRTLAHDGIALVQSIGSNTSEVSINAWTEKYIFPNGMLPSIAQLSKAMEGLFVMEDWHNFGPDYDRTLMAWHERVERAWPRLQNKYSERFHRMWRYYLLSCAGGFRSRNTQLWQIVMTRPGTTQPHCRP